MAPKESNPLGKNQLITVEPKVISYYNGNTVGSRSSLLRNRKHAYILGLWGADGYHRTSSIGLTTIHSALAKTFQTFLLEKFSSERLRLRVYFPDKNKEKKKLNTNWFQGKISHCEGKKLQHFAYQIYVNSRPLLREFRESIKTRDQMETSCIPSYFAGRFDGDGSVNKSQDKDFRIVYKFKKEAILDRNLLVRLGFKNISIYRYRKARTYALYVWQSSVSKLVNLIRQDSFKLKRLLFAP